MYRSYGAVFLIFYRYYKGFVPTELFFCHRISRMKRMFAGTLKMLPLPHPLFPDKNREGPRGGFS